MTDIAKREIPNSEMGMYNEVKRYSNYCASFPYRPDVHTTRVSSDSLQVR